MQVKQQSALVLLHHGLGDVIMALPFLTCVARHVGPSGSILVYVNGPAQEYVVRTAALQARVEVISLSSRSGRLRAATRIFRPFDYLFAVHGTSMFDTAIFALLCRARVKVGRKVRAPFNPWTYIVKTEMGGHKVHEYMSFAAAAGCGVGDCELKLPDFHLGPGLGIGESAEAYGAASTRIALCPGSGAAESHKRWPLRSFAELAQLLIKSNKDAAVAVIGSESERGLCEAIAAEAKLANVRVLIPKHVSQFMKVLECADCVVTNCNGASHVAALLDVPIVGIYGPTNPSYTGPFSKKLIAVSAELRCRPCYSERNIRGCGTNVCMELITPYAVFSAVNRSLAGCWDPPRYKGGLGVIPGPTLLA